MDEKQKLSEKMLEEVSGGARGWTYYCPYCGEDYSSEEERQSHIEEVHGIVTCPMCKHPMKKGSACEVCGYAGMA